MINIYLQTACIYTATGTISTIRISTETCLYKQQGYSTLHYIIRSKPCHLAFNIVLEELYQQGTKIYLYVGLKNNPTVIDL